MAKRHPRIMIEIYQNKVHEVWSDVPLKCIVRNLDLTRIRQFEVKVVPIRTIDGQRQREMEQLEEISDLIAAVKELE